jgi:hypothetical protein
MRTRIEPGESHRVRTPSLLLLTAVVACSRTGLDAYGGTSSDAGTALPDGPVGTSGPTCASWVTTHDPVQVSNIASIIGVESAIATPSGVLVGYADDQFPPVDTTWHGRMVAFGDGALGSDEAVLDRDTSEVVWTRVTFAQGFGHSAAAASEQSDGLLFTAVDATGAPTGAVVRSAGDSARDLVATAGGYTILRSPFDPSGATPGPVSLATLDTSGNVTASSPLLDASTPILTYSRVPFADGSFSLIYLANDVCPACRSVHAQHFSGAGDALTPGVTLHTFDATSSGQYAISASSKGLLLAWTEESSGETPLTLVAAPFDPGGQPLGEPSTFAQLPAQTDLVMGLGTAPGGDLIAAWIDGLDRNAGGNVHVQSVAPDGTAEGPATTLAPATGSSDESVLVVASAQGAMVLYESDVPNYGIEVYAIPLKCAE